MPEKIAESVSRIQEALKKIPREDAEAVANDAAIRAETIADYAEMIGRSERTRSGSEANRQ